MSAFRLLAMSAAAAILGGCGSDEVQTDYGKREGVFVENSVNGTSALSGLFTQAGHRVTSRFALSPGLAEAHAIVWFPDDYAAPSDEVVAWLERWLLEGQWRTLVYVGRDFDAAPDYWRRSLAKVADDKKAEIRRHLIRAEDRYQTQRVSGTAECDWFTFRREKSLPRPEPLGGPWAEDLGGAEARIAVNDELEMPPDAAIHLTMGERTFAASLNDYDFGNGQLIVVQNGSFLLNLPLVSRGNRHLAARLIEQIESQSGSSLDVVFLESGAGGPRILESDPQAKPPTMSAYPPPLSDMLYHGIALAIVAALASWPIFGRPRRLPRAALADFGRHVDSVAEMLARSRDEEYCRRKVEQFREG